MNYSIAKLFVGTGVLSLIILLSFNNKVYSQSEGGFYLKAAGGYSFQSGKTEFNNADPNGITGIQQSTDIRIGTDGVTHIESLNGTLGEGIKLGIAAGYMFNRYIGAELGVNYVRGSDVTIGRLETPTMLSEANAYIRGVDISPALVITPGYDGINPYARVGLLLTAAGDLTIETSVDDYDYQGSGQTLSVRAETEVKPKFSVGYVGALGALFPISDRVNFFVEGEFKSFTLKSDKAEIQSYETTLEGNPVPGQQLEDLPTNEKKFVFSDDFSTPPSGENINSPREIPTQYVNANGLGVNIGLIFKF